MPQATPGFDTVIVGGGSAGAVLAARLSQDPARQVLLVEAGPDHGEHLPPELADITVSAHPDHDWGDQVRLPGDRSQHYPRGRVLGGSSAVNGGIAIRAMPDDFDGWGFEEWRWEAMLGSFRRLESDPEGDPRWHGRSGPIPVQRTPEAELHPVHAVFYEACEQLGHPYVHDHNAPGSFGAGPLPRNRRGTRRVSTADAYLLPASSRPNLHIWGDALAVSVTWKHNRATGVELLRHGTPQTVAADQVVVAAGVVQSPLLLWRSGVGPAPELSALGIRPVAHRPGVGANFSDHPAAYLYALPRPGVCEPHHTNIQTMLRFSSSEGPDNDLQLFPVGVVDLSDNPRRRSQAQGADTVFAFNVALQDVHTRGSVRPVSADPHEPPIITYPFLAHPPDLERLAEAFELGLALLATDPYRSVADGPLFLDRGVSADDLRAHLFATHVAFYHGVGTCAMGTEDDLFSVVGPHGQVWGTEGLHVCDASIMPTVPRANTNLNVIAVAERMSELLA